MCGGEKMIRTRHKVHNGGYVYVVRNKLGQITDVQNIGRAIRQDTARYALNVPSKPNQGNQGDYQPTGKVISAIRSKKKLY